MKIVELLNYMRDDDEFDRYMAPQTISNRHKERDIEAIDRNEIFYFFGNENPLKVDDKISGENSIITKAKAITIFNLGCLSENSPILFVFLSKNFPTMPHIIIISIAAIQTIIA